MRARRRVKPVDAKARAIDHGKMRAMRLMVVIVGLVSACSKDSGKAEAGSTSSQRPTVTEVPAPPPPSPLEVLQSKTTLAEAIEEVRSQMADTDGEVSPGAALLALWSAKHLKWTDVAVAKNETSFKLVRKDSDLARGKRLCVRGQLVQIEKEKVGSDPLFTGLMLSGSYDIYSFIAVRSTGELVSNSHARFCGVVIGKYEYSNSAGGRGHAISVVGMFDLQENRAL